jgi:hypothetical protein
MAVIGGVLVSTCLTLVVVSAVYTLPSRLESRKHEKDLKETLKELGKYHAETTARTASQTPLPE